MGVNASTPNSPSLISPLSQALASCSSQFKPPIFGSSAHLVSYGNDKYDEWFKNMYNFDDYLASRNQLLHVHEPDDPLHNPYTWTHKQNGTLVWAIMAQDPEKIATFQVAMSGLDMTILVVGHFDFSLLKNDNGKVQLVDVGGGHGAVLKQILDKYPELDAKQCVLQDLPDVIEMAKGSGSSPDVTLMPHDFRT
jgi:hypothetical protein